MEKTSGAVGPQARTTITIGEVEVEAIFDTGSQVTTISESLYRRLFNGAALRNNQLYRLTAANGLDIPLLGYLVTDVTVGEEVVTDAVVMVTRDATPSTQCLLGTNILQHLERCPPVKSLLKPSVRGLVRTLNQPIVIPPLSIVRVSMTGGSNSFTGSVLFEPSPTHLRTGLFALAAYTQVTCGRLQIPICNTTEESLFLPHRVPVGHIGEATMAHEVQLLDETTIGTMAVHAQDVEDGPLRSGRSGGFKRCSIPDLTQLTFGPQLSSGQRRQVEGLVKEYSDVFAWTDDDMGFTDVVKHEITVTTDAPVAQPYRRIPPSVLGEVKQHLQDLLARGIIQPSASPYASPIVLVRKKSGELRMCVDYRKLNSITRRDQFPLPRIEECLDALGGAQLFTSLDLASGYHQVAMHEKDMHRTAFTCPFGLYEFKRMPFGLCNAPATFQRLMQTSMHDMIFEVLLAYLDDLMVFAKTFEGHIDNLERVLKRLREIGVKLNPTKCCFFMPEVSFLGHIISGEGIATNPDTIRAVVDFPRPNTIKDVRSFLGLASYYRRFVKDFAKLAKPLHQLTTTVHNLHPKDRHKGEKKVFDGLWTHECELAFLQLKQALTTAPVLGYADYTRPFILEVDASLTGLGAVLSQKDDEGRTHVIAYASRSLRPNERKMHNYSSLKLELLALKWAVAEKFRGYLLGHHVVIYTDNNPLSHLETAKFGATEMRWASELQVFNYELKYKPGKNNNNADALSRYPAEKPVGPGDEYVAISASVTAPITPVPDDLVVQSLPLLEPEFNNLDNCADLKDAAIIVGCTTAELARTKTPATSTSSGTTSIASAQRNDSDIGPVLHYIQQSLRPTVDERQHLSEGSRALLRHHRNLQIKDGILVRRILDPARTPKWCTVIPSCRRRDVIELAHDKHGHQGQERTLQILQDRCFWPGMAKDVRKHIEECDRCRRGKRLAKPIYQPPGHLIATQPLEVLAIDFLKLDVTTNGLQDVLVKTDIFTKWSVAVPTPDQTAATVVRCLIQNWILRYGVPTRLHSDRGMSFTADIVRKLCQHYNIKRSTTTPYHPQGNGQCERFNRSLIALLSSLPPEQKLRWDKHLEEAVFYYNSTPHSSTGLTPYALLFGREPHLPLDLYLGKEEPRTEAEDHLAQHLANLAQLRQVANDRLQQARLRTVPTSRQTTSLQVGDHVLRKLHHRSRAKIADSFGGPTGIVLSIPPEHGGYFRVQFPHGEQTLPGTELTKIAFRPPEHVPPSLPIPPTEIQPNSTRGHYHR